MKMFFAFSTIYLSVVVLLHVLEFSVQRCCTDRFQPQTVVGVAADYAVQPIMRLVSMNFKETLQRGHFSNKRRYVAKKPPFALLIEETDPDAGPAWWYGVPLVHLPFLSGGWDRYVVLEPIYYNGTWFVGWWGGEDWFVRTVRNRGPVRMLIGSDPTQFIGITASEDSLKLRVLGYGMLGDESEWSELPLL